MKNLNMAPAITGLLLGMFLGMTVLPAQAKDNAYNAYEAYKAYNARNALPHLVWTASGKEKIDVSPEAVSNPKLDVLKAARLRRKMEGNTVLIIDRLSHDIDKQLMEAIKGAY